MHYRQTTSASSLNRKGPHNQKNFIKNEQKKRTFIPKFMYFLFLLFGSLAYVQFLVITSHDTLNKDAKEENFFDKGSKHGGGMSKKQNVPRVYDGNQELLRSLTKKKQQGNAPSQGIEPEYHIVFSTDCSSYQHWQSYLLFYSAMKVQQKGYIVRIASGCTPEEQTSEQEWHTKHITNIMSSKYLIHFTPVFDNLKQHAETEDKKGRYEFFNKPFGLRHWFEHGYLNIDNLSQSQKSRDVVILLDPDMVFLRPISHDFTNRSDFLTDRVIPILKENKATWKVQDGIPFAQIYGYGNQWLTKIDQAVVTGDPNTPALNVSLPDARKYYPIGPPYLATIHDMYNIAVVWTDVVPGVHKQYPYLLAEMFAFSIAAAHLKLPHQVIDSLMVSSVSSYAEGWRFVDKIPDKELCLSPTILKEKYALPNVFHFCQRYILKNWMFAKRRPELHNFFSCQSPLLATPTIGWIDELKDITFRIMRNKQNDFIEDPLKRPKYDLFSICQLVSVANEAATHFKENSGCNKDEINWEASLSLWEQINGKYNKP